MPRWTNGYVCVEIEARAHKVVSEAERLFVVRVQNFPRLRNLRRKDCRKFDAKVLQLLYLFRGKIVLPDNKSEIVIFKTPDNKDLYGSSKANVSEHIKHIFEEEELSKEATVRKFRTVQKEGERKVEREVEYYNLDMIISLGYRIKSKIATQFRQWATKRLNKENNRFFWGTATACPCSLPPADSKNRAVFSKNPLSFSAILPYHGRVRRF